MKKKSILALILAGAMALTACGGENGDTNEEFYSFIDSLGNKVVVKSANKVCSFMGSYSNMWELAGGTLAGATEDSKEQVKDFSTIKSVGTTKSPNVEKVISLGTDFVIMSSKTTEHVKLKKQLESAGITTAYFQMDSFEEYLYMLKVLTDITGKKDLYEKYGTAIKQDVEENIAFAKTQKSKDVLFIRAYSTGAKAKSTDSLTGKMLKDMNCNNIADSDSSILEDLSMEVILKKDPEFIFVTTMGSSSEKAIANFKKTYENHPAWSTLSAVKNNKFIFLPQELFHNKPNAKWGESYDILREHLYGQEK